MNSIPFAMCLASLAALSLYRFNVKDQLFEYDYLKLKARCSPPKIQHSLQDEEGEIVSLSISQLRASIKTKFRHGKFIEKSDLVNHVLEMRKREHNWIDFFSKLDLAYDLLKYLDIRSVLYLSLVNKSCACFASVDSYWYPEASCSLGSKHLSFFDVNLAGTISNSTYEAFQKGFFSTSDSTVCWKSFLSFTNRGAAQNVSGEGQAVIVSTNDLRPHHIFNLCKKISQEKVSQCTLKMMSRCLETISECSVETLQRINRNAGYLFGYKTKTGKKLTSISLVEFRSYVASSNIRELDLIGFYASQKSLKL